MGTLGRPGGPALRSMRQRFAACGKLATHPQTLWRETLLLSTGHAAGRGEEAGDHSGFVAGYLALSAAAFKQWQRVGFPLFIHFG